MHLSKRFSCMCVRQEIEGKGDNKKTGLCNTGRDKRESEIALLQTQGFREKRLRKAVSRGGSRRETREAR